MDADRRQRALSFGAVSEDYDRYRPGPVPEVLDWLLPPGARSAVDAGAGTGALTRLLVDRLEHVTAVEPDERMRRTLTERVPGATVVAGRGEALPVADGSQDAVLYSSAWHWVDPERAVGEAARVLRPGGRLGVLWTLPDYDEPWVAELWSSLRGHTEGVRDRGSPRRKLGIPDGAPFDAPEGPHDVRFTHRFTRKELVGLTGTYSAVIVLPDAERRDLLDRLDRSLAEDPRYVDGAEIPMLSQCWRAARRVG
jgi:SAM-dependent methyltransferase